MHPLINTFPFLPSPVLPNPAQPFPSLPRLKQAVGFVWRGVQRFRMAAPSPPGDGLSLNDKWGSEPASDGGS